MDEDQNALAEQESGGSEDFVDGGEGQSHEEGQEASEHESEIADKDDPHSIKKRLGMQAKKHQREMRQVHEQLRQMHEMMSSARDSANPQNSSDANPYPSPGQPNPPAASEEERIQKAVRYALGAKEHEERKAKEAEREQHLQKQYHRLNGEFDKASEKYDDFDEVVRGDDVPFTHAVRDALLLVDNPADVAYQLGKNRTDLERISKLHPWEQAREVNKLSFSLMGNGNAKSSSGPKPNPMGSIKGSPAASGAITGKTPPSVIRARMKAGTWK